MEEIKKKHFHDILQHQRIYPVYQPIVSLKDGDIYGYEALSRIERRNNSFGIEEMFQIAEKEHKLWELEELCRTLSLQRAMGKKKHQKLFLNVDANVINEESFVQGFTKKRLDNYGLSPKDIIFEITERTAIEDKKMFQKAVNYYKNQGYKIAIDDVGAGYSGLNRICAVAPKFLKIDMGIVRDIHKDSMKRSLAKCMLKFCEELKIGLIAEGIETKEELDELIRLGVCYGQGFYLGRPSEKIEGIAKKVEQDIIEIYTKYQSIAFQPSFFGTVDTLYHRGRTTEKEVNAMDIFELFHKTPTLTEICVIDKDQTPIGILTRRELAELFSGRFGFSLNAKRNVEEIMRRDFLMVDGSTPIEVVSKVALARVREQIYDEVVIIKNEKYIGTVSIKDLLEAAVTIQVTRAVDSNPLTGLPGNLAIQDRMKEVIQKDAPYAIIYFDLDNFKAYNDAYGFNNGDLMIQLVAESIKESGNEAVFRGHIGGDDFVMIAEDWNVQELCEEVIHIFTNGLKRFYSETDWENGYIVSKNRNGIKDTFPLASLSVSVITNQKEHFSTMDAFSKAIAKVKKESKMMQGNSIIFNS